MGVIPYTKFSRGDERLAYSLAEALDIGKPGCVGPHQETITPAYPTTMSRSPEMSPEVAYFTNCADLAPSCLAAVSIATAGPNPHMLMFCSVTTSCSPRGSRVRIRSMAR